MAYFTDKPFWIAGLKIFSSAFYYLLVVPFVFVLVAVPVWAGLAWLTGGAGAGWRTELVAMAFAWFIIGAHYVRRADQKRRAS